jgi:hypothetical protein
VEPDGGSVLAGALLLLVVVVGGAAGGALLLVFVAAIAAGAEAGAAAAAVAADAIAPAGLPRPIPEPDLPGSGFATTLLVLLDSVVAPRGERGGVSFIAVVRCGAEDRVGSYRVFQNDMGSLIVVFSPVFRSPSRVSLHAASSRQSHDQRFPTGRKGKR